MLATAHIAANFFKSYLSDGAKMYPRLIDGGYLVQCEFVPGQTTA